eukprot:6480635-Amphidinium_carterae.1
MTAYRVVMAKLFKRRMTLDASNVVLRFTWLVVAVFGPSLPVLNVLVYFLSKIYPVLLFESDSKVLEVDMRDGS